MNHTPPPWTVKDDTNVMAGKRLVANTGGYQTNAENSRHVEENRANAHLISATVDLHAACQAAHRILTQITNGDIDTYTFMEAGDVLEKVQDALDKAEGNDE